LSPRETREVSAGFFPNWCAIADIMGSSPTKDCLHLTILCSSGS